MNDLNVFELQGLYGSYSVPESVLQHIWYYGDFNHKELRTQSGKPISILNQLLSKQSRSPSRNAWVQGLYNLLIKQFSRIIKIPNEHSQRDASMVHFRH